MRKSFEKVSPRKYWINIILPFAGVVIVFLYGICEEACAYLKGSILSIDLEYVGIFYMGVLILFNLLKKRSLFLFFLSFGLGAEIYLTGFQIKNLVYCYYCLSFGAIILILFLINFDMSKKIFIGVSLIFGFILFLILFQGMVTPLYAEDFLLPSFGTGKIHVRLYTDYFCGPCSSLEPKVESVILDLVEKKTITIIFIDIPIHKQTVHYAKYFLYILNENKDFKNALYARSLLFEAAKNKIVNEEKLELFLRERKVKFRPFYVLPTFALLNNYIKEDKVNATPTCVIFNGEKKRFEGTGDIIKALESLPR